MAELPIAFLAGLLSIVTPCVLPLVPGYLSAVSAVEADRLGEPGVGRRAARASVPFILGFTAVFVALGAGAAALGATVDANRRAELAGLVLVVVGLAFLGLLPWPERIVAPGLLSGARKRGSNALLGAAFAVCAAPCIGTVLASVLVLAGNAETALRGSLLLAAYSAGLGAAFVLAGVAFVRAMGAFRWLRDNYRAIRVASGASLVVLGLLFFFHRDGWIRVGVDRALGLVGL
jgi:cytochrome c-type biogenesis protein